MAKRGEIRQKSANKKARKPIGHPTAATADGNPPIFSGGQK
jgi:hypothetical protein